MFFHFEHCLHVPFVLSGPGIPDDRRDDYVSLIDIFPTVCDLTGIDAPDSLDGRSVFRPASKRRDAVFAENGRRELSELFREVLSQESFEQFARGLKSVRTDNYLYTVDSGGEERLYELPDETEVNLSEGPVDRLREMVYDTLGETFPPGSQSDENIDNDIESNLRQLGYIE